jgi:hypothetical protein
MVLKHSPLTLLPVQLSKGLAHTHLDMNTSASRQQDGRCHAALTQQTHQAHFPSTRIPLKARDYSDTQHPLFPAENRLEHPSMRVHTPNVEHHRCLVDGPHSLGSKHQLLISDDSPVPQQKWHANLD